MALLLCILNSCSKTNDANTVEMPQTFSFDNSVNILILPTSQINQTTILPGIPTKIDSAYLAKNKTSFSLLKTLKLSNLSFTPSEQSYAMTNFDTITFSIGTDSLSTSLLGAYSGLTDSVYLTNLDFAQEIKKPEEKFYLAYRLKKPSPVVVTISTAFRLTFLADSL